MIFDTTIETYRGGLCDACFLSDLQAESAAAETAERQEIAARDAHQKRAGKRVRVSAWVHPQAGGDDYQVDWHLSALPTPAQVQELLRQEGSGVLDDYHIRHL